MSPSIRHSKPTSTMLFLVMSTSSSQPINGWLFVLLVADYLTFLCSECTIAYGTIGLTTKTTSTTNSLLRDTLT
jgi:hypothetical protein